MLCSYYVLHGDLFFSTAAREASGLEEAGNFFLTPLRYLVAGKEAYQKEDGSWEFVQEFQYNQSLWPRSTASIIALPVSVIVG